MVSDHKLTSLLEVLIREHHLSESKDDVEGLVTIANPLLMGGRIWEADSISSLRDNGIDTVGRITGCIH